MNKPEGILHVSAGKDKWKIDAIAIHCGESLQVTVVGGEKPHIGAVALAIPRQSLSDPDKTSASSSVLCVTGHKDDEFARDAALQLAAKLNAIVCVSLGIHIANAAAGDIDLLRKIFSDLMECLMEKIAAYSSTSPEGYGD